MLELLQSEQLVTVQPAFWQTAWMISEDESLEKPILDAIDGLSASVGKIAYSQA